MTTETPNHANKEAISVRWLVEVYPFDTALPSPNDFGKAIEASPIPPIIIGSAAENEKTKELLRSSFDRYETPEIVAGLVSLSISREKTVPDASCSMKMVGPLPPDIIPGTWIIISSVGTKVSGETQRLVRFIGQIHTIAPSYSSNPETGLITVVTDIACREWSAILRTPIRYDYYSVQLGDVNANPKSAVGHGQEQIIRAAKLTAKRLGLPAREEIEPIISENFDPLGTCHMILRLLGAMSDNDANKNVRDFETTRPEFATAPPRVPFGMMKRLGIKLDSAGTSTHPYTSGFVKVISGSLKEDFGLATGEWDGIFGYEFAIRDLKFWMDQGYEERSISPYASAILALAQTTIPAWDLLNQYCDNAVNEVFTDMLHQYKFEIDMSPNSGGKEKQKVKTTINDIGAQPVIFIRDKPFLMRYFKNSIFDSGSDVFDNWSHYDDVPRIQIPQHSITDIRFVNTFINSPNYIRINLNIPVLKKGHQTSLSAANGFVRMLPEQHRFGGQEFFAETQYLNSNLTGENASKSITGYTSQVDFGGGKTSVVVGNYINMRDVLRYWHGYNYRMSDATLVLKDDNYALTVGFNASFRIGSYRVPLIGHITSLSYNFYIDETGLEHTDTQVGLTRVVRRALENNDLEFVSRNDWGRLHLKTEPGVDHTLALRVNEAVKKSGVTDTTMVDDVGSHFKSSTSR